MTDKLSLYKGALRVLGGRTITSLTDSSPSRYVLDEVWDDNFLDDVLIRGLWNFALRTVRIEYTSDLTPDFGYQRAFDKPSDWIRTNAISANEFFNPPLTEYSDKQSYWFADYDTLYVDYVSKDSEYGYDLSLWPVNVVKAAECLLGAEGAERITQSRVKKKDIMAMAEDKFLIARGTDAMNQPAQFPPSGSWVSARRSNQSPTRYSGGWK